MCWYQSNLLHAATNTGLPGLPCCIQQTGRPQHYHPLPLVQQMTILCQIGAWRYHNRWWVVIFGRQLLVLGVDETHAVMESGNNFWSGSSMPPHCYRNLLTSTTTFISRAPSVAAPVRTRTRCWSSRHPWRAFCGPWMVGVRLSSCA